MSNGFNPLMNHIKTKNLGAFRKELRDNPSSINYETKSGKTPLALVIHSLYVYNPAHRLFYMVPQKNAIEWCMFITLVQLNAKIGNWIPNYYFEKEVRDYIQKVRMRRFACSATLRTLLGLKKFKKAHNILSGANRDVMLLITKPMMKEAGRRVEWDYEEREREKKRVK